MHAFQLSTDVIPERERFSVWRETVRNGLIGVRVERHRNDERPFHGSLAGVSGGSVARVRCRASAHASFRDPRDIARRDWHDHFFLYRDFGAGSRFRWGRGELETGTGDLAIGDPTVPLAADPRADLDYELWVFPRHMLDPHLPAGCRPKALRLTGGAGIEDMMTAYLDAFAAQFKTLDDAQTDAVAETFCRLLAVACGASTGGQTEAVREARLAEAKRWLDLHLADPDLTPQKAADALRISLRQLYHVFEPSGDSVAQYILRRRLEACRQALANPGGRSVTDIAFAWGFNSLATFHRNFRQAFGAAPSEVRQAAAGQTRPAPRRARRTERSRRSA